MTRFLTACLLYLALCAGALAQCNGVFPAATLCGNNTGSPGIPGQFPASAITGVVGGSPGQVQFNNAGAFGGLTNTQLTADINTFTSGLSGAAPASGGGTVNYLRADGTWAPLVLSIDAKTGAFTTANGVTTSGNVIQLANTGATLEATPANPGSTASGSVTMMGLGSTCHITPVYSTRIQVAFYGNMNNSTAADGVSYRTFFGTGTAPTNGATITGTQVGATTAMTQPAASGGFAMNFSTANVITGLTAGTAYWLDLSLATITGGTAAITNVTCSAMEY